MLRNKLLRAGSIPIEYIGGNSTVENAMSVPEGTMGGDTIILFAATSGTPTGFSSLGNGIWIRIFAAGSTTTINNLELSRPNQGIAHAHIALCFRNVNRNNPLYSTDIEPGDNANPPAVVSRSGAIVTLAVKGYYGTSSTTAASIAAAYSSVPTGFIAGPTQGDNENDLVTEGETNVRYYNAIRRASAFQIVNNSGAYDPDSYSPATGSAYTLALRGI